MTFYGVAKKSCHNKSDATAGFYTFDAEKVR